MFPLTGNTSGDDDDIGILERSLGAIVGGEVASNFLRVFFSRWMRYYGCYGEVRGLLTALEEMWDRSAATPGVLTTSYRESSSTRGQSFRRRDNG